MKNTPLRHVGAICAAGLVAGAVGFSASALQAGTTTDTATVSVTIAAAAKVGLVTLPVAAPAKTGGIPSIPISTTSNVGYGSPAPATSASGTGAGTAGAAASTGTSATPEQAARAFAARGAAPISIGPSAAVAVAGAPNQTFNVILPGKTSFASGDNVVSLSGFQHSAGATPALGSNGSGTFSIGAAVDTAPVGDTGVAADSAAPSTNTSANTDSDGDSGGASGSASGQQTGVAGAFTKESPIVNISVSYN